jgi:hypothetical protein
MRRKLHPRTNYRGHVAETSQIRGLVEGGTLPLSLFDDRDMAALSSPDYPDERLILRRNPDLAAERARKRDELLQATVRDLAAIRAAVGRAQRPLRGTARIAYKVGAVLARRHMARHFAVDIADDRFPVARKAAAIVAETALDGFYAIRTPVRAERLDDAAAGAAVPPSRAARARPRLLVQLTY